MGSHRLIHLNVAELALSREPAVISTILGSCVSVCLHSPESRIGGMIHYALPSRKYAHSIEGGREREDSLRFGDESIEMLIAEMLRSTGLPAQRFRAKIAGGGSVVDQLKHCGRIGELNVEMAESELRRRGIPVVGRDVGGTAGRKILFYTDSGRLRAAPLRDAENRPNLKPSPPPPSLAASAPERLTATPSKKRVLIIDDSKTIRSLLTHILDQDPGLEVVGSAASPIGSVELVKTLRPDVITLDIHMPGMDGIEFLQKLYPEILLPVVVVTSISKEESDAVFRALELGAVDYVQKPRMNELAELAPTIREKVRSAASIRIRARSKPRPTHRKCAPQAIMDSRTLIAIGASTGGTEALKEVLIRLPQNIPPILIVQHIPPVFSTAFANRLNELCSFEVKEAEHGDVVRPGRALIAPGGFHMRFKRTSKGDIVTLDQEPPVQRHRPSVDVLFRSVAQSSDARTIGVILTGMGTDGAQGLLEMRSKKARTIAQDEESCVVYGMPKEAVKLGAAEITSPLLEIPDRLLSLLQSKKTA